MSELDLSAARWRKSSRSGNNGGDCVEVAGVAARVAVRDSKNPDGTKLAFARTDWSAFAGEIRAGRYDRLG